MNMKKALLFIGIISMCLFSCSKEENEAVDATITGVDQRLCMCCGGWFIQIGQQNYRFLTQPKGSTVDLNNPTFPLEVKVKWMKQLSPCLGDEIDLLSLELK